MAGAGAVSLLVLVDPVLKNETTRPAITAIAVSGNV